MDVNLQAAATAAATMPIPTPTHPNSTEPLISRLPATISGPVRARRRRFSRFKSCTASLKGTALIIESSASTVATMDVHHVFLYPNGRLQVRSDSPVRVIELRIDQRRGQWITALRAAATKRGPLLSDFEVVAPVGKGGGGSVFLVREHDGGRSLAMKVVQKHDAFYSNGSLRHAMDERVVLELVRGFPFVITLRHAFQTATALYMVSDFCSGGNLRRMLTKADKGRLDENKAKRIMVQIVLAVEYLHEMNVLYRDLKPDNVLFSAGGDVRLCDFGLSKVLSTGRFGRTKSFCGSTSYMSPQVVSSKSYGIATDLWSMGALFYRMLVGRAPFDEPTSLLGSRNQPSDIQRRIRMDDVTFPGFISAEAREMLDGLLRKDEADRMNMQDLKESLFFKGVNWEKELREGYKRAVNDVELSDSSELDNFDTERLISHGIALKDDELVAKKKKAIELGRRTTTDYGGRDEPRSGFVRRRISNFGSFSNLGTLSVRRPTQMTRRPSVTSIIGFGFSSAEELSASRTDSDTSDSRDF